MKQVQNKVLIQLFLCCVFSTSIQAQSDIYIGVSLIPNYSLARATLDINGKQERVDRIDNFDPSSNPKKNANKGKVTLNGGISIKKRILYKTDLRSGIFFFEKGTKSYWRDYTYSFHDRFIEVPVDIIKSFYIGKRRSILLLSGISFNYRIGTSISVKKDNKFVQKIEDSNIFGHPDHLKRYVLSGNLGVGLSYSYNSRLSFFALPLFKRDITPAANMSFNGKLHHYSIGAEFGCFYIINWEESLRYSEAL